MGNQQATPAKSKKETGHKHRTKHTKDTKRNNETPGDSHGTRSSGETQTDKSTNSTNTTATTATTDIIAHAGTVSTAGSSASNKTTATNATTATTTNNKNNSIKSNADDNVQPGSHLDSAENSNKSNKKNKTNKTNKTNNNKTKTKTKKHQHRKHRHKKKTKEKEKEVKNNKLESETELKSKRGKQKQDKTEHSPKPTPPAPKPATPPSAASPPSLPKSPSPTLPPTELQPDQEKEKKPEEPQTEPEPAQESVPLPPSPPPPKLEQKAKQQKQQKNELKSKSSKKEKVSISFNNCKPAKVDKSRPVSAVVGELVIEIDDSNVQQRPIKKPQAKQQENKTVDGKSGSSKKPKPNKQVRLKVTETSKKSKSKKNDNNVVKTVQKHPVENPKISNDKSPTINNKKSQNNDNINTTIESNPDKSKRRKQKEKKTHKSINKSCAGNVEFEKNNKVHGKSVRKSSSMAKLLKKATATILVQRKKESTKETLSESNSIDKSIYHSIEPDDTKSCKSRVVVISSANRAILNMNKFERKQSSVVSSAIETNSCQKKSDISKAPPAPPPFVIGEVQRPPKMSSINANFKEKDKFKEFNQSLKVLSLKSLGAKVDSLESCSEPFVQSKSTWPTDEEGELTPIFKEEFEHLYDKLKELNQAILILKDSYRNLIRSLVQLNYKRKEINPTSSSIIMSNEDKNNNLTMLTTASEMRRRTNTYATPSNKSCFGKDNSTKTMKQAKSRNKMTTLIAKLNQRKHSMKGTGKSVQKRAMNSPAKASAIEKFKSADTATTINSGNDILVNQKGCQKTGSTDNALVGHNGSINYLFETKSDQIDKVIVDSRFALEHFLNPLTRDDTFQDLFNEVRTMNESLTKLKEFFDDDGYFIYEDYKASDFRITRSQFDMVRQKTQMFLTIVLHITRIYNRDLLEMFRIN